MGSQKILGPKLLWVGIKILGPKQMLGLKNFGFIKFLGPKNVGSEKRLGLKKNLGPEKC